MKVMLIVTGVLGTVLQINEKRLKILEIRVRTGGKLNFAYFSSCTLIPYFKYVHFSRQNEILDGQQNH